VGDRLEVGVLGEADGFWPHDEGVAVVAVSFSEGAINGDGVAAFFDGVFSFFDFDGDVTVNEEDIFFHAEFLADAPAEISIMDFMEVGVFDLFMSGGVIEEVALEGGHF